MNNPCRNCDLLSKDKNNDRCVSCSLRLEYLRYLDNPSNFMPVQYQDNQEHEHSRRRGLLSSKPGPDRTERRRDMSEQQLSSDKVKLCKRCGPEKGPLPISKFTKKAKAKDGLDPYCKQCKKDIQQEYRDRKAKGLVGEPGKKHPSLKQENPQASQGIEGSPVDAEYLITLDFSEYPELHTRLKEIAVKEFRPTDLQVIYFISQAIENRDGAPARVFER